MCALFSPLYPPLRKKAYQAAFALPSAESGVLWPFLAFRGLSPYHGGAGRPRGFLRDVARVYARPRREKAEQKARERADMALTTSLREATWLPVVFHRIFPPQAHLTAISGYGSQNALKASCSAPTLENPRAEATASRPLNCVASAETLLPSQFARPGVPASGTVSPFRENVILNVGAGVPPMMSVPIRSQSGAKPESRIQACRSVTPAGTASPAPRSASALIGTGNRLRPPGPPGGRNNDLPAEGSEG